MDSFFRPLILGCIFFLAGLLLGQSINFGQSTPVPQVNESADTSVEAVVSAMIDYGNGDLNSASGIPLNEAQNPFEVLEWFEKNKQTSLDFQRVDGVGVFVKKIGEKENGSENKFWQYWVNNRYAMVASDSYALRHGDSVEWKFIIQQPIIE